MSVKIIHVSMEEPAYSAPICPYIRVMILHSHLCLLINSVLRMLAGESFDYLDTSENNKQCCFRVALLYH